MTCELCNSAPNETILFSNELFRIIAVNDTYYPGFIRLILNRHVKEVSELNSDELVHIFNTLIEIEREVIKALNPDKMNIASLGNVVPHVHWHIIPRFNQDRHFPNPIWGSVTNSSYLPSAQLLEQEKQLIHNLQQKFN